jgi:predicted transcriptional regulator
MIIKEFTFEKKDGTIRTIKGTDDWKNFYKAYPDKKPLGKKHSANHVKVIYDLEDNMFKSFIKDKFISERIVGFRTQKISVKNNDFYHKAGNISFLKRRKTPYFLLSMLSNDNMSKSEMIMKLSFLSEKLNISKNQKRNVTRLIRAFTQNDLIEKINNTYTITAKGKLFLENNVK